MQDILGFVLGPHGCLLHGLVDVGEHQVHRWGHRCKILALSLWIVKHHVLVM